jgi:membrane-bound lytic murein transglycosylase MltF
MVKIGLSYMQHQGVRPVRWIILLVAFSFLQISCSESAAPVPESAPASGQARSVESVPVVVKADFGQSTTQNAETDDFRSWMQLKALTEPWSGDFDGMVKRRVIRVLTVYGLGRYFLDGPQERGVTYEIFKAFEASLNKELKTGTLQVHVVFLPVSREELIPWLLSGRGDIAAAGLTITSARERLVDFSIPFSREIREVLVTGPSAPAVATLDDLAGKTIHVRKSSSYDESLRMLNTELKKRGNAPVDIEPISELLEDEDLMEMVQAGLLPWMVVDDYKAQAWSTVFDKLVVRTDLVFRTGGRVGYAFRKNSPKLAERLNAFIKANREGTMLGNVLINRYIRNFEFVKNALNRDDMDRYRKVVGIFQKYGEEYGFDYLMITAQGYQESRLDQSLRSHRGAVGVMQLLPSTAADPNVGIADIYNVEPNIHAGIRYLDFIRNTYFSDLKSDRFNQTLMSLASYNAGPARIQKIRQKTALQGLNPNVWFGNVEVTVARAIGRETVQYVANIFKYYTAYRMIAEQQVARQSERERQKFR